MTQLLEQALEELQKLPSSEQDVIASLILEEIQDEQRWEEAFARSQDRLEQIAAKVRADIRAGRIRDTAVEDL